jgi:hypothetical protein
MKSGKMRDSSLLKIRQALEALITMNSWQNAILLAAMARMPNSSGETPRKNRAGRVGETRANAKNKKAKTSSK